MKRITTLLFVFAVVLANAQSWSAVGSGLTNNNGRIESMCVFNGELYVGGFFFNMGGINVRGIAKWNGSTWDSVPGAYQFDIVEINCMTVYNNQLVVGGLIQIDTSNYNIAAFNGSTWNYFGELDNAVYDVAVYNNELYATGRFEHATGIPMRGIAKWNGTDWDSTGGGGLQQGPGYTGYDLEVFNGKLYLAGLFDEINGLPANGVAQWNGVVWDTVGIINAGSVGSFCVFNSTLHAGALMWANNNPTVHKMWTWDEIAWDSLSSDLNLSPRKLVEYNYKLYAVGDFDTAGYSPALGIASWDAAQWNSVSTGLDLYYTNQDTFIDFNQDTSYWTREHIFTMCVYNNELYVGGTFLSIGGISANSIARWHEIGAGTAEDSITSVVQIFPNPATEIITFQFSEPHRPRTIIIFDQVGSVIWRRETTESSFDFPAIEFSSGMYFYTIIDEQLHSSSGKFIIER